MKLLLSVLLGSLLLANVFTICAQEISGQETRTAEQEELIALSTQWMEAVERKDRAALERFLADGFYISRPGESTKIERSEWLKGAFDRDWHDLRYYNFKVDVYGDTAVVTALLDSHIRSKWGFSYGSDAQVTDIWVKRDGQWRVAARHLGAYSIVGWFRLALGFIAGLALCFVVWLLLKIKRRFAAKKKLAAA